MKDSHFIIKAAFIFILALYGGYLRLQAEPSGI